MPRLSPITPTFNTHSYSFPGRLFCFRPLCIRFEDPSVLTFRHWAQRHVTRSKRADWGTGYYRSSNPWTLNFSVRLFSVTIRTTSSGTPSGTFTEISSVTSTSAPGKAAR
jgi:hypothetical protein